MTGIHPSRFASRGPQNSGNCRSAGGASLRVDRAYFFGSNDDKILVGDWNGSGTTKIGLFRFCKVCEYPSGISVVAAPGRLVLQWILDYNGNGILDGPTVDRTYFFGQNSDVPIVGDWDGSGTTKIGLIRAGQWVLDFNGDGAWSGNMIDRTFFWGQPGDTPAVGRW